MGVAESHNMILLYKEKTVDLDQYLPCFDGSDLRRIDSLRVQVKDLVVMGAFTRQTGNNQFFKSCGHAFRGASNERLQLIAAQSPRIRYGNVDIFGESCADAVGFGQAGYAREHGTGQERPRKHHRR